MIFGALRNRLLVAFLLPTLLVAGAIIIRTTANWEANVSTAEAVRHDVRAVALVDRLDERTAILRTLMWQHALAGSDAERARVEREIPRVEAELFTILSLQELADTRLGHEDEVRRIDAFRSAWTQYATLRDVTFLPASREGNHELITALTDTNGALGSAIYASLAALDALRQGYVNRLEAELSANHERNGRAHANLVLFTFAGTIGVAIASALYARRLARTLTNDSQLRARAERAQAEQRRADQAERLAATLAEVGSAARVEDAAYAVLRGAVHLLGGTEAVAQLFGDVPGDLALVARVDAGGNVVQEPASTRIVPGSITAGIAAGGPAALIEDFDRFESSYPLREQMTARGVRAAVVVPLIAAGRRIGVLHVYHSAPGVFGQTELALAEALASQAGAGIERLRLEYALLHDREELRRRELQLAEAQRLAHLGSWEWHLGAPQRGTVADSTVVWSDELYRIFGLEPHEIPASYQAFLERVHTQDRSAMRREILRALKDGRLIDSHFRIVRPSGEVRHVHARASVERDTAGRTAVAGSLLDVTEHMRTQAQLQDARDAALAASTAKSEFLANMSHEIRTPMNAIIGMADLLAETPLAPEQEEYVRIFRRAGESLLTLINDILDLSKVEAGYLTLDHTDFDPHEIVERSAEVLAVRAHGKGLELICDVRPEVPTRLGGDPQRLRQVLINLLGNAVKFTVSGEVGVRVERDPAAPTHPGALRFTVWDTGIGIPAEKLDAVFETFTQADASTTRKYGGSGLGLTISRRLVQLMGGEMSVQSAEGQGSTFTFTVRFSAPKTAAGEGGEGGDGGAQPLDAASALHHPTGAADNSGDASDLRRYLEGRRVLVVDDNATNRLILRETLAAQGAIVSEAVNGAAALNAVRQSVGAPYRLILLDRRMPGMDGFEVAERLREEVGSLAGSIIMLTSDRRGQDIAQARTLGMAAYLVKPIRRNDLLATIAASLQRQPEAIAEVSQVSQAPAAAPTAPVPLRARILMAEDSEDNRALVQMYLRRLPYTLEIVGDGKSAVERVIAAHDEPEGPYHVVLMDVQMPVMDGLDATAAIRAWEQERGVARLPILALTANAMTQDVQNCLAAGCDGHLAKPIKKQTLIDAIAKALTEAQGASPTGSARDRASAASPRVQGGALAGAGGARENRLGVQGSGASAASRAPAGGASAGTTHTTGAQP